MALIELELCRRLFGFGIRYGGFKSDLDPLNLYGISFKNLLKKKDSESASSQENIGGVKKLSIDTVSSILFGDPSQAARIGDLVKMGNPLITTSTSSTAEPAASCATPNHAGIHAQAELYGMLYDRLAKPAAAGRTPSLGPPPVKLHLVEDAPDQLKLLDEAAGRASHSICLCGH